MEVYIEVFLDVFGELFKGDLVALFVLAVVIAFFLHCVVCEVDHFILQVLYLELLGGRPDVAFGVPVPLLETVDRGEQGVAADVKLPFVV